MCHVVSFLQFLPNSPQTEAELQRKADVVNFCMVHVVVCVVCTVCMLWYVWSVQCACCMCVVCTVCMLWCVWSVQCACCGVCGLYSVHVVCV